MLSTKINPIVSQMPIPEADAAPPMLLPGSGGGLKPLVEFDLQFIAMIILKRWWVTVLTLIVILVLAWVVIGTIQPKYSTAATIIIEAGQIRTFDISGQGRDQDTGNSALQNQVELIKSAETTKRVAAMIKPIGGKKPPSLGTLRRGLSVSRRGLSYLIDISYVSGFALDSQILANSYADAYIAGLLDNREKISRRAVDLLSGEIERLRIKLNLAERKVEEFRTENNLIDAYGALLNERQISEISHQLVLARVRQAEMTARAEQIDDLVLPGEALAEVRDVQNSSLIVQLRALFAKTSREAVDLQQRYRDNHPKVQSILAQQQKLRREIEAEVRRIYNKVKNESAVAEARERALENGLKRAKIHSAAISEAAVHLKELERQAETTRVLYKTILSKQNQLAAQMSLNTTDARIVSRAPLPTSPTSPKPRRMMAAASLLGVALGIFISLVSGFIFPPKKRNARSRPIAFIREKTAAKFLNLPTSQQD